MFYRASIRAAIAAIVATGLVAGSTSVAYADPPQSVHESPAISDRPNDEQPTTTVAGADKRVETTVPGLSAAAISLPGTRTSHQVDPDRAPEADRAAVGEALVSTTLGGSTITSYTTNRGSQTLIEVPDSSAPEDYAFELDLPTGTTASLKQDGSVGVFDSTGEEVGSYATPWAYDADGRAIPTSYEVEGDTLKQHIETSEASKYPIIADPSSAWGWTVCVATVSAEVAGNAFVAAKLYKVIRRFGSIRRTMEIMVRAWNSSTNTAKKWAAVRDAVGGTAAEIIGIDAVKNACFD